MLLDNETELLSALYGIQYFTFLEKEMIDKRTGAPFKFKKNQDNEKNRDAMAIYKWIAEQIRGISESEMQKKAELFNTFAKDLKDDLFLNRYLMSLFLMDKYLETKDKATRLMIQPKITRLIKVMREAIIKANANGVDIVKDSSLMASNIWRLFNGQAQLTREVRAANTARWREAARNKQKKSLASIYNLGD